MSYPDDIDAECVPLCDVLNSLPGIKTCESCCGHEVSWFRVWFDCTEVVQLRPIMKALNPNKGRIVVAYSNVSHEVFFMLELVGTEYAEQLTKELEET